VVRNSLVSIEGYLLKPLAKVIKTLDLIRRLSLWKRQKALHESYTWYYREVKEGAACLQTNLYYKYSPPYKEIGNGNVIE